jgi:hypothetical protein
MSRLFILITSISLILPVLLLTACAQTDTINEKVSSLLLTQINLRKEQIAEPTPQRLEMMKELGMRVDNLEIQQIFIHLTQKLNQSQVEELEAMGITLYLDSWIPPVGAHPTGFIIADIPVDKLEALASKDYVVRLDTAERVLEPEKGAQPESG